MAQETDKQASLDSLAETKLATKAFLPLSKDEILLYIAQLGENWQETDEGKAIQRNVIFTQYWKGVELTLWLANLAEKINHHPDIYLGYKTMTIKISTHNIGQLSLADFVLAAKIERELSQF